MTVNFSSGGAESICWRNKLWDPFLLQARFEGLPCLPTDSGISLWALHTPRELLLVTSDLACMRPCHSVNICFKAHWPRSQGSGSCSGLTSNCLGSWGKVIHYLWAFIYSTWDQQTGSGRDGKPKCYAEKDSEAVSRPPREEHSINSVCQWHRRADNQPSKSEMQDIKWLLSKTVFPNYDHDSFCVAIENRILHCLTSNCLPATIMYIDTALNVTKANMMNLIS